MIINRGPGSFVGWLASFGDTKSIAGCAFLVAPNIALTCAHVVCKHLGQDRLTDLEITDHVIELSFEGFDQKITGQILSSGWFVNDGETHGKPTDIAVVYLTRPLIEAIRFPALAMLMPTQRTSVEIYGITAGFERFGKQVRGEMTGQNLANGRRQIDPVGLGYGFVVERGFSGAPVFDELGNSVLGMIVAVPAISNGVAYAINADDLWTALKIAGAQTSVREPNKVDKLKRSSDSFAFLGSIERLEENVLGNIRLKEEKFLNTVEINRYLLNRTPDLYLYCSDETKKILDKTQKKIEELDFLAADLILSLEIDRFNSVSHNVKIDNAAVLAESGRVAALQRQYKRAANFYISAARKVHFDSKCSRYFWSQAANLLGEYGYRNKDAYALNRSIRILQSKIISNSLLKICPLEWAAGKHDLAVALGRLSENNNDDRIIAESVSCFRSALTIFERQINPLEWAATQSNLSRALTMQANATREKSYYSLAVDAQKKASEVFKLSGQLENWVFSEISLSQTLASQVNWSLECEDVGLAIDRLEETLKNLDRNVDPYLWAYVKAQIGQLLWLRVILESRIDDCYSALEVFNAALEVFDRYRDINEWIVLQSARASVLGYLSETLSDVDLAKLAVEIHQLISSMWSKEGAPQEWRDAKSALAGSLSSLGERTGDVQYIESAAAGYEEVLSSLPNERGGGDLAEIRMNFAGTLMKIGYIKQKSVYFRAAIVEYGKSLELAADRWPREAVEHAKESMRLANLELEKCRILE